VYQYLCKRRISAIHTGPRTHSLTDEAIRRRAEYLNERRAELYEIDLYLVLVYEGLRPRHTASTRLQGLLRDPRRALLEWLSSRTILQLLESDLERAMAQLYQKAAAFEVQLADSIAPVRLNKADAFRFFRGLLNYTRLKAEGATLQYDTHLDYFVADSSVECHRTHLDVDRACVKVLTMKEPPSATFAHLLEDLYAVPGEFIACLEWQRIGLQSPDAVKNATASYLQAEDAIATWIDESCQSDPQAWESCAALFDSWSRWATKAGEPTGSNKNFAQKLEARGYRPHRTHAGRGFYGLRI